MLARTPRVQLFTHSRIAAYKTCPRKHWYFYKLRRRAIRVAHALFFGTMIHKCLERYWLARQKRLPTEECYMEALRAIYPDIDPFDRAKAVAMITCYVGIWSLFKGTVLFVEKQFEYVMVNPYTGMPAARWHMGGKIDLGLRTEEGIVKLGEHKTTSDEVKPGGAYRQRTEMDPQISGYMLGAHTAGVDAAELIYDVLKKPKKKPLRATPTEKQIRSKKTGKLHARQREHDETPEQYAERIGKAMEKKPDEHIIRLTCERTPEATKRYYLNVWQWAEKIDEDERAGIAPQNEDSCWKFNQPCDYWPVCSGKTTIDNPIYYRNATSAHEELQEVDSEECDEESEELDLEG